MCIHTYRYTCMQYTDTYTYTYTRTIREQKHKHTYRYRQLKSLSKEEDDNEVLTFLGLSFLGSFLFSHIPTSPTARLPLRSLRRRRWWRWRGSLLRYICTCSSHDARNIGWPKGLIRNIVSTSREGRSGLSWYIIIWIVLRRLNWWVHRIIKSSSDAQP